VTKPTVKGGLAPADAVDVKGRGCGMHRGVNWQEPTSASTGVRCSRSRWIEAVLLGGRIQFTLRCSLRWRAGHRAVFPAVIELAVGQRKAADDADRAILGRRGICVVDLVVDTTMELKQTRVPRVVELQRSG
jgi:hypothetical protein